jgi:hypothetical protein
MKTSAARRGGFGRALLALWLLLFPLAAAVSAGVEKAPAGARAPALAPAAPAPRANAPAPGGVWGENRVRGSEPLFVQSRWGEILVIPDARRGCVWVWRRDASGRVNLYFYADNDPVNKTDPFGRDAAADAEYRRRVRALAAYDPANDQGGWDMARQAIIDWIDSGKAVITDKEKDLWKSEVGRWQNPIAARAGKPWVDPTPVIGVDNVSDQWKDAVDFFAAFRHIKDPEAAARIVAELPIDFLLAYPGVGLLGEAIDVGRAVDAGSDIARAEKTAARIFVTNEKAAIKVASTGVDILPGATVRQIGKGEKVKDLIHEVAELTYKGEGAEHAIISLKSGERLIVRGGAGGIDFSTYGKNLDRIILHTHGRPTGPSDVDFQMLKDMGQKSSYIYELFGGGYPKGLTKFTQK